MERIDSDNAPNDRDALRCSASRESKAAKLEPEKGGIIIVVRWPTPKSRRPSRFPGALPLYVHREQRYLFRQRYGTVSFVIASEPKEQVFWFYLGKNP